jgi:LSD1 subclass zinc finger protein
VALNYCEVCGILIANAPPGVPATICPKCFASRKVLLAPDPPSDDVKRPSSHDRVQFVCPSCRSILQLPPVKKRTKIKCPQCSSGFAMHPDGRIEPAAPTAKLEQQKLLGDLKPARELDDLLARVPEKKVDVLPSVLQSDSDESPVDPASASAQADIELDPSGAGPGQAAKDQDYELVPDSGEQPDVPESRELDPVRDAPQPRKKIATARRSREQAQAQRKEQAERAKRTVEAQKYTIALVEKKRVRTLAVLRLSAYVLAPLLVSGIFLTSTTSEGGFAVKGGLGHALGELGDMARRGVDGVLAITGSGR